MRPYKRRPFSKQTVIDSLSRQIDSFLIEFDFDSKLGWQQVVGADIQTIVDYGRFRALWDLRESIQEGTL